MPRPKKPNHLKVVRGTDQPCRMKADEVEFDPVAEVPEPPEWLTAHAQNYWRRVAKVLTANKVLTEGDLEAMAVMCVLFGKIRQMSEAGVDMSASLINALRAYQGEFGLTPASRAKITKGDADKENPFAKHGRKAPQKGKRQKAKA